MREILTTAPGLTKRHARAMLLGRIDKYEKQRKRAYDQGDHHSASFYNGRITEARSVLIILDSMA